MSAIPGSGAGNKSRVLVVDDSRVMRKAIERVLSSEYDLIEAGDGEAGWDALNSGKDIRVVISDVQMPILDGYGMICRIRAADDSRVSDIPIIVITGADDEITKERAYACGANDFIAKPIDSSQLLTAVRNHTGSESRAQMETAGVDPLTQIANRDSFLEAGRRMLADSKKSGDLLSLIRLDVDSFDAMRTAHGDDVADQILIWTSKILLDKIRKQDFIGQLGRSQFSILTSSPGRVEAAVLCDRIRAAVSAGPYRHEGRSVPVTLSIGLVTAGHDQANSLEELIDLASQRVAVARSRGGNQLIAGDNEQSGTIEEAVIEEPDLETALQIIAGLKNGNFDPYAIDLAQRVLPLLEYCDEKFQLSIDREIAAIRARLAGV
jgi:two-component system cell cycle response regulator